MLPEPTAWGRRPLLVLAGLFVLFALVRATSPVDLLEGDQGLQAGYIMDLLHGGSPAVQYEVSGRIATKPPLYNWLAALAARTLGTAAPWVIKLPSLLAGAGLVWIIFLIGRNLFGTPAGLLGAGACLASFHFMRLAWLARTDMVMVFLLHLAVYLAMALRREPGRSLAVGLVLGACFLTKGPVGPLFFLGWLLAWGVYGGGIKKPKAYLNLLPGLAVFLVVAGLWVWSVWDAPGFRETVVGRELGRRVPLASGMEDPVYLYFTWLLARVAPWPLIALAGLWPARKRPERREAFFLGLWALTWLIMLSAVGVKRADLILPVYPAVFVLAGLGLAYLFHPGPGRAARIVSAVLGLVLALLPLSTPWLMNQPPTAVYWLFCVGSAAAGLAVLYLARQGSALVLVPLLAGLIIFHGLHHHGLANRYPLNAYARLAGFLQPLKQAAAGGEVRAWKVHPLISYELGIHVPDRIPLAETRPKWVIIEPKRKKEVQEALGRSLTRKADLTGLKYGGTKVALFRVGEE